MHASPKVSIDDQATTGLADIKQQILGIGALAAGISIGVGTDEIMTDLESIYKQYGILAAKGKSEPEILQIDQQGKEIASQINPNMDRAEAMLYTGKFGNDYAKRSAMLGVTTNEDPQEWLNAMIAMKDAFDVDNAERLGNSIQYMANTAKDLKGELVDSLVEYSVQTSKFLDSPEKMAALVDEMSKLGVWSLDKGFDSLKETTLKLTNEGDLTNVLKTGYESQGMDTEDASKKAAKESAMIQELLTSKNKKDNQYAVGALMMNFASIKEDKVRQNLLNELGAGAGEDLARKFAPVLIAAGRLATNETKPNIGSDYQDRAYKAAVEANPLFEYQKAQAEAKQSLIDMGAVIAQDVTPIMKGLSEAAEGAIGWMNSMDKDTRLFVELSLAGAAIVAGGKFLFSSATAHLKAAYELQKAARMLGGEGADDGPDIGPGDSDGIGLSRTKSRGSKKGKTGWKILKRLGGSIGRKLPYIGGILAAGQLASEWTGAEDKGEVLMRIGAETGGGMLGGAAAGALAGSIVPGIGTAIGAALGSIIGGFGGGWIFDQVKEMKDKQQLVPIPSEVKDMSKIREGLIHPDWLKPPAVPSTGLAIPTVTSKQTETNQTKLAPLTVQSMPITLKAEGVLQDLPTMMKMLRDPSVANEVKRIVERAFINALETKGGVSSYPPSTSSMGSERAK